MYKHYIHNYIGILLPTNLRILPFFKICKRKLGKREKYVNISEKIENFVISSKTNRKVGILLSPLI